MQFQVVSIIWRESQNMSAQPIQWIGLKSIQTGKMVTVEETGIMHCNSNLMSTLLRKVHTPGEHLHFVIVNASHQDIIPGAR